jgi:hypothetical protein
VGEGPLQRTTLDGSTLLVAEARTSAKRDLEMKLYRSKSDLVLLAYAEDLPTMSPRSSKMKCDCDQVLAAATSSSTPRHFNAAPPSCRVSP